MFVRGGGLRVASAPRQYYAATARVRCICVNTSSREIDERSEREWGRERRPGDGVRGVVRRRFSCKLDAALEKAAAISRYRGGRLGSISSHG